MSWVLLLFQATDRKTGRERISVSRGCIPSKESYWAQIQCFLPPHSPLWVHCLSVSSNSQCGWPSSVCGSKALSLSLPSSVTLSSAALLHCCLWFQWHGFIWAVVRVIGVVKSPSGRCSLACQWRVASWSEGTGHVRGRGEQRGAWEDSGCILGKWLVEALIHRPGCAQDWVHGILTVYTPSTELVPLKAVAGKLFPPGFLGPWGNNFLNYAFIEAIKKEQWINLDFKFLPLKRRF